MKAIEKIIADQNQNKPMRMSNNNRRIIFSLILFEVSLGMTTHPYQDY